MAPTPQQRDRRMEIVHAIRIAMAEHSGGARPTQRELMVVLGVTEGQVSQRFRGEVPFSIEELEAIAAHYGKPLTDLVQRRATSSWGGLVADLLERAA